MKTKNKTKSKTKARPGKKQQKKKIIVASVAVGAAGILGYFGWQYLKKRKEKKNVSEMDAVLKTINTTNYDTPATYNPPKPKTTTKISSYTTPTNTTDLSAFPLKKGSKGNNVKLLQEALISKYGKSILPKYGSDGDFGTETANALKKAGLPATINESTFNVLTQATKIDAATLGK